MYSERLSNHKHHSCCSKVSHVNRCFTRPIRAIDMECEHPSLFLFPEKDNHCDHQKHCEDCKLCKCCCVNVQKTDIPISYLTALSTDPDLIASIPTIDDLIAKIPGSVDVTSIANLDELRTGNYSGLSAKFGLKVCGGSCKAKFADLTAELRFYGIPFLSAEFVDRKVAVLCPKKPGDSTVIRAKVQVYFLGYPVDGPFEVVFIIKSDGEVFVNLFGHSFSLGNFGVVITPCHLGC